MSPQSKFDSDKLFKIGGVVLKLVGGIGIILAAYYSVYADVQILKEKTKVLQEVIDERSDSKLLSRVKILEHGVDQELQGYKIFISSFTAEQRKQNLEVISRLSSLEGQVQILIKQKGG